MNYYKSFSSFLLFLFFILALSEKTAACSGTFPDTPFCYHFANAERVYEAKVVKSASTNDKHYRKLTFEVKRTFKGEAVKTFEAINLVKAYTSCDRPLEIKKGETWIILTSYDTDKKRFEVGYSSFKFSMDEVPNESYDKYLFNYLEKARQDKSETELHGQMKFWLDTYEIITKDTNGKGYKVTAEKDGQTLTTYTSGGGDFIFPSLSPGKYKIRLFFPNEILLRPDRKPYITQKSSFDENGKFYFFDYETEAKEKECVFDFFVIRKIEPDDKTND